MPRHFIAELSTDIARMRQELQSLDDRNTSIKAQIEMIREHVALEQQITVATMRQRELTKELQDLKRRHGIEEPPTQAEVPS